MVAKTAEFAQILVRRAVTVALTSRSQSAREAGLAASGSFTRMSEKTFKKALWKAISHETIAAVQQGQINAYHFRTMNWGNEMSLYDVQVCCDQYNWPILAIKHNKKGEIITQILTPNFEQRDKGLDKLYKLMGEYAPEKHEIARPLEEASDEDLMTIIRQHEALKAESIEIVQPKAINDELNPS